MKIRLGIAAAVLAVFVGAASAQQSEVVYSYKHWQVLIHGFDDGTFACEAKVGTNSDSFSVWTYPNGAVSLQFYSAAWQFSEEAGQYSDLSFEVDRRGAWSASGELYMNSVLIELPDSQSGVNLITEIARGNRLYLRDADGSDVQDYSLAGSSASIDALIDCGNVIQSPGNPFN